jgi:hypothetical protein
MRKTVIMLFAAIMLLGVAVVGGRVSQASGEESAKILDFDTMVGVPDPYTGATNAIRGVPGGGLPWVIDSAKGKLRADGRIDVSVMGLVLDPNDPDVPAAVAGTNPVPTFKAIVSCMSKDAAGTTATTVNVSTDVFPADTAGNSTIRDTVDLPRPCIAPIVFVGPGPFNAWFASTGF